MPNVSSIVGLVPARHVSGFQRLSAYEIAGALASNIFIGDPVIPVGTNKRINVGTAGARLIGVFQGCSYINAQGETRFGYWPTGQAILTGTTVEALVFDDPDLLFSVQVSGAAGLVAGDVGAFADFTFATAGNAATGRSGVQLDQTTITSTDATGGQVRIEELQKTVGNAYGQYAKALVRMNEDFLASAVSTANLTAI